MVANAIIFLLDQVVLHRGGSNAAHQHSQGINVEADRPMAQVQGLPQYGSGASHRVKNDGVLGEITKRIQRQLRSHARRKRMNSTVGHSDSPGLSVDMDGRGIRAAARACASCCIAWSTVDHASVWNSETCGIC